jgi:type VI secretion system protein ImpF
VGEVKQSVREDLQMLFNTRQGLPTKPRPGQPELAANLQNSLLTYGLPDFCATSVVSTPDQNRIRRALEVAIERFEPRLRDVRVTLLPSRATERALHFRIDASLRVEPAPEPVTFDTVLLISSGEYRIEAR